ncbi:MAG: ABC transporter permease [Ignavibacteria bacterium]|jgi:ABC-2 type transport system permease protein|nr:ABC transporter permease [Ignavibacteria bacterium]
MKNKKPRSKILIIIEHEYISKIKTKGFIIGTIIAPIALALLIAIPAAVTYFSMEAESSDEKIAIVDKTGAEIAKKLIEENSKRYIELSESEDVIQEKILAKEIGGALLLSENSLSEGSAKIFTSEETGLKFVDDIKNKVNSLIKDRRLKDAGISQETIDLVDSSVKFETVKVTKEGVEEDNSEIMSFLSYILALAMYGLMFLYGSQVMQGVVEEKTNRVIEILASSAKPFEIMFGKVIGIGAVGLTQVLFWIILAGLLMTGIGYFAGSAVLSESVASNQMVDSNMMELASQSSFSLPSISPWLIVSFVVYFLLGYFLYATLFAAIGATVDQMQDANSISGPVSLLIIIPILFIPNIMVNPEGILAVVLSLIPFFTPILMIARLASIAVPLWQVILSYVLMILTFFLCLKFAAKIYKIAMLKYGKKPTFKDIVEWVRM